MTFDTDDPRLTAYALGETEDLAPGDLTEIEQRLTSDPEARAHVDAVRALGAELAAEFAGEAGPTLTAAQRATITGAAPFSATGPAPGGALLQVQPRWVPASVAAAALAAIGLLWSSNMPRERLTAAHPGSADEADAGTLVARGGALRAHPRSLDGTPLAPEEPGGTMGKDPASEIAPAVDEAAGRGAGAAASTVEGVGGRARNPFERVDTKVRLVPPLEPVPETPPRAATKRPTRAKPGAPTPLPGPVTKGQRIAETLRRVRGTGRDTTVQFELADGSADGSYDLALTTAITDALTVSGVELTAELRAELPQLGKAVQQFHLLLTHDKPVAVFGRTIQHRVPPASAAALVVDNYAKVLTADSLKLLKQTLDLRVARSAESGGEAYQGSVDNPFRVPSTSPLSTFSIDVDTASYANVRRFLNAGTLPPREAVRLEELINYFSYGYAEPNDDLPFSVNLEVAGCPWNTANRLVRIGLRGRTVDAETRGPSNVVFLLDVSGSMRDADKLPLLKSSMKLLVQQMREQDTVGIVVYSGDSKVALESTAGSNRAAILGAIDALRADGSTNGGAGIRDAYAMAERHLQKEGVNRVVLATDGDFNVGVTDRQALVELVRRKAEKNVFLTVLGFGTGNLKDATLEQIADRGNGNYHYVDSLREGRRVLVEEMNGTLVTIAKDVKLQVEFNPSVVAEYRLIGYANRLLAAREFNDDRKDAGEIGAGHTVTALYEVVPTGAPDGTRSVDPLKYQDPPRRTSAGSDVSREMLTVKLRFKEPEGRESTKLEVALTDEGGTYGNASRDFKFAAGVAAFGMLLRSSPYRGTASYGAVLELAGEGVGDDVRGYRTEFLDLVRKAETLTSGR